MLGNQSDWADLIFTICWPWSNKVFFKFSDKSMSENNFQTQSTTQKVKICPIYTSLRGRLNE
jgi:hypothetical protein